MPGTLFNEVAGVRPAALLKNEILAQVFSCGFCEIFRNISFYRTPPVSASVVFVDEAENLMAW